MSSGQVSQSQQTRLSVDGAMAFVDLHCHCLPGLDDGPDSIDGALALCRALVKDGITAVVATPHQLGRYDLVNSAARVRAAVEQLNCTLRREQIPLKIHPGADVRLDERILKLLEADQVLTVADRGTHLLLELPHETYIDPLMLIRQLVERKIQPIITHPERQPMVCRRPEIVQPWVEVGALLQVTAGSLLGSFGTAAQRVGWQLLASGLPTLMASDAHDAAARPPRMTRALEVIGRRMGRGAAYRACIDLPLQVFRGTHIEMSNEVAANDMRGGA